MTKETENLPTYHGIIKHQCQPLLLLKPEDDRWSLPTVQRSEQGWFPRDVMQIGSAFREKLGLKANVLRHIQDNGDAHLCELEVLDESWTPDLQWRWISAQELETLKLEVDFPLDAVRQWFTEVESGILPALRTPWERRGWWDTAVPWIEGNIAHLGYTITGPVEPHKTAWGGSAILKVETNRGRLYFKAVYQRPPGELELILAFAETHPDNVPKVLAADRENGWMLLEDFGDKLLDDHPESIWPNSVGHFARMQIEWSENLPRWRSMGCPEFDLPRIASMLEEVVADEARLTGISGGLTDQELKSVREVLPDIRALFEQLATFEIPLSLHQEDFRGGNVTYYQGNYIYFDWCDTIISHPFLSVNRMLDYISPPEGIHNWDGEMKHEEDGRRRAVRDAYLQPWEVFGSRERLLEAFALSRPLNGAYQAVRWYFDWQFYEPESPWAKVLYTIPASYLKNVLALHASVRDRFLY